MSTSIFVDCQAQWQRLAVQKTTVSSDPDECSEQQAPPPCSPARQSQSHSAEGEPGSILPPGYTP